MDTERLRLIPEIVPPTAEEMKSISENWWKDHEGINMSEWNDILVEHSFPFRLIKVDKELTDLTIDRLDTRKNHEKICKMYSDLIAPALKELGCKNGFFFKLITRSPKDYMTDDRTGLVIPTGNAESMVVSIVYSVRCAGDMCMLSHIDKFILVIRPFINISPRTEYRVMVEDKKIVGISQYYYNKKFSYWPDELQMSEVLIRSFFANTIIPNVDKKDFVADVVIDDFETGKILLIELNPFGLSDPCLFKSYDQLDGSFRYVK